jgi:hypothetical protein
MGTKPNIETRKNIITLFLKVSEQERLTILEGSQK